MSRKIRQIRFSDSEWNTVCQRAKKTKSRNVSEYVRHISQFGLINVFDFEALIRLRVELNKIGTNINQIAHLCNETQNVNRKDVLHLQAMMSDIEKKYKLFMKPLVDFRKNNEEDDDEEEE